MRSTDLSMVLDTKMKREPPRGVTRAAVVGLAISDVSAPASEQYR